MLEAMKARSFEAQAEHIPAITEFVTEHAEQAGLNPKILMQLDLVVEEVVVNICNYAYEEPGGDIVVRVCSDDKKFVLEFEDGGRAFDPLAVGDPDLTSELEERDIGGLGIFFIKRLTDEVSYRRVNNRNILALSIKI